MDAINWFWKLPPGGVNALTYCLSQLLGYQQNTQMGMKLLLRFQLATNGRLRQSLVQLYIPF